MVFRIKKGRPGKEKAGRPWAVGLASHCYKSTCFFI